MHFRSFSKLTIMLLALIVFSSIISFLSVRQVAFAKSSHVCPQPSGSGIVAIAEAICVGQGQGINGWTGNVPVPYVKGGGHYPESPGPNTGLNSTLCLKGQTCGVDCSGFTRWVYFLAYGSDVLRRGKYSDTKTQIQLLTKDTSATLGDLVFFGPSVSKTSHVGIYIGPNEMIDSPNATDHPPHFVRLDPINQGFGNVLGYYRYTSSSTSADWPMANYDATGTRYNLNEHTISPSNAGKLVKGWSQLGGGDTNDPIVANGVAYIGGTDGKLYAFNASTGQPKWSSDIISSNGLYSDPAVTGSYIYVGSTDGNLYVLSVSTGKTVWKFPTGGAIYGSPVVLNNIVYIGSSDNNMYAVNTTTRKQVWSYPTKGSVGNPAVTSTAVYFGSSDFYLYAVSVSTGKDIWPPQFFYCIPGSEVVVNTTLYVGDTCGDLESIDAGSGTINWTEHTVGGSSTALAVANNVIYIGYTYGNTATMYAFDATKKAPPLWAVNTDGLEFNGSSPVVANGVVYIGSDYGSLYAFDASSGKTLWKYPYVNAVFSSPIVANGTVYVGELAGYMDTFHLPS